MVAKTESIFTIARFFFHPNATYQSPESSSYFVSKLCISFVCTLNFFVIPEIAYEIADSSVSSLLFIRPIPGFIDDQKKNLLI